jgi:1-acyl-sn-glycerol-3-phosphate acyltransferase
VTHPRNPLKQARSVKEGRRPAGDSLLLFPQGSILGIELAFQPGAFALGRRLGRPILLVVPSGSHRVWEHPFSPTLRWDQRVAVTVLPPVPAREAVARRLEIEATMRRIALANLDAPPRLFDPARDGYWDGYRYDVAPTLPTLARAIAAHRHAVRIPGPTRLVATERLWPRDPTRRTLPP